MAKEKKISPLKVEEQKAYNEYVKEVTPTHSLPKNMAKAFLTGGIICVVGQAILQYCGSLGLDKDTSGLVAVAKNAYTHHKLTEQMNTGELKRTYLALAEGIVTPSEGTVETDIRRIPGRATIKREVCPDGQGEKAITQYRVLERINGRSLLKIQLETGRTHQIRVHMASIGHPLLGDTVYGNSKNPYKLTGQTLHAMTIGLEHPRSGEYIEVSAPLPDYFQSLIKKFDNIQ